MSLRAALRSIRPLAKPCRRHHSYLIPRVPIHTWLLGSMRQLATPPPMLASSDMSMDKYHNISDESMEVLLECFEALVDSVNDRQYEVEYSSGVLTLTLGSNGTYVINKQPPNKQIWLSSPLSGPKRYDFSETRRAWFYSRDGKTLGSILKEELQTILDKPIHLDLL